VKQRFEEDDCFLLPRKYKDAFLTFSIKEMEKPPNFQAQETMRKLFRKSLRCVLYSKSLPPENQEKEFNPHEKFVRTLANMAADFLRLNTGKLKYLIPESKSQNNVTGKPDILATDSRNRLILIELSLSDWEDVPARIALQIAFHRYFFQPYRTILLHVNNASITLWEIRIPREIGETVCEFISTSESKFPENLGVEVWKNKESVKFVQPTVRTEAIISQINSRTFKFSSTR